MKLTIGTDFFVMWQESVKPPLPWMLTGDETDVCGGVIFVLRLWQQGMRPN
jgi:hypothetical protein